MPLSPAFADASAERRQGIGRGRPAGASFSSGRSTNQGVSKAAASAVALGTVSACTIHSELSGNVPRETSRCPLSPPLPTPRLKDAKASDVIDRPVRAPSPTAAIPTRGCRRQPPAACGAGHRSQRAPSTPSYQAMFHVKHRDVPSPAFADAPPETRQGIGRDRPAGATATPEITAEWMPSRPQ